MNAQHVLEDLKRRFPNEPEYHQAVEEVLSTNEDELDISILIEHLKGEKTYCIDNAYERELVQDYFDKRYVLPDSVAGKELFFEYFSNRPKPDIEAWWDLIMQAHRIK